MLRLTVIIRLTLLALLLAGVCACSRSHSSRSGSAGHTVAGFGGHEIVGIDISAHNGEIDFERVRDEGVKFVIIKATEGGTFKDKKFIENVRRAREAGLKVGAYHFFRFDTPGYMQGLNFINSIHGRDLDLPAAIDIEEFANPNFQATQLVMNRVADMADHLESHGYRVMLYTNKKGHARFFNGRLASYPLWICSLGSRPEDIDCTLWQATHHGTVDGIEHDVDINVYTGPRNEWENFTSGILSTPDAQ